MTPKVWRRWVLEGVLGGLGMAIAAPPFGLWPLAWISLMPLWRCAFSALSGPALMTALVWGLTYNGITLHWVWGLHPLTWMGIPVGASWAIACCCWLAVTVWTSLPALFWMIGMRSLLRVRLRPGLRLVLGVGLWCGLDGLLSGSALYWDPLALTQSPGNRAILHLGRLGGPMLVTGAIVAVNGLLAHGLLAHGSLTNGLLAARRMRWRRAIATMLTPSVALLLLLHGLGGWLAAQPLADDPTQALSVGVIQGNIPTRIKLTDAGITQSVQRYTEGYRTLALAGADAVLMPEGALPFVWAESQDWARPLTDAIMAETAENSSTKPTVAWVGAFGRAGDSADDSAGEVSGDRYTQSLFGLVPTARQNRPEPPQISRYNKTKLVPLGEYIPLESSIGALLGRISPLPASMAPGSPNQQFETPWGPAAVQICYEPAFSAIARRQVARGAQWILSSANLDPYSEALMAQSEAHDVMRAIETDRWLARASNTGYSGFIDPHGRILWRSSAQTAVVHLKTIYRRQTQTPYIRWGGLDKTSRHR
ncbi:MAG: apolipoprotein N-acyltransferase [Synechococcales cyanobacterium CRU_2_2]|nr:apolipoprotein N-acyltransferase [Synechococcales cyanobacterium CRU_2_2]